MSNLKSIIESLLFTYGEPLSLKKLADITEAKPEDIRAALDEMKDEYKTTGIVLLQKGDEYQLGSHPDTTPYIEKLMKGEFSEELSRAALETATIIAYKGPITRANVEHIRGVNSSFTIRNLMMRGLIERIDNPTDSRSYLYRISFDFLKHLGLSSIEELPNYIVFKNEGLNIPEETPKQDQASQKNE